MGSKAAGIAKGHTGRVGERRQVVIPREIFEKLKMREGDVVAFAEKQGGILVKPKRARRVDDTVLTAAEAKLVRRGEAQLKRGESKAWRDVKDALAR